MQLGSTTPLMSNGIAPEPLLEEAGFPTAGECDNSRISVDAATPKVGWLVGLELFSLLQ
jgi:hypothetical protein